MPGSMTTVRGYDMIQDCTTPDQGIILAQEGVDEATADKCWIGIGDGNKMTHVSISLEQARENRVTADKFLVDLAKDKHPQAMIPSWSLTALIQLMPTETLFGRLSMCRNGEEITEFRYGTAIIFGDPSPVKAAFQMVYWLLKADLLRK